MMFHTYVDGKVLGLDSMRSALFGHAPFKGNVSVFVETVNAAYVGSIGNLLHISIRESVTLRID